jgi:hypothetical protein
MNTSATDTLERAGAVRKAGWKKDTHCRLGGGRGRRGGFQSEIQQHSV